MPSNMLGDEKQLTKAEVASTEAIKDDNNQKTKVTVYFNPKELSVDKVVPWSKHKNTEGDAPTLEFTAAEPKKLSVELLFDMFEEKGDVYKTYVSKLEKLALVDGTLKRPPLCTFTWGSNMPVFKGVIEQLGVKYTLFLPDGTPTRATVSLKMQQANKLLNKQEAKEANKRKTQSAGTQQQGGQRPDQVANAAGDENYRDTMTRNNVDNPNDIPPGTNLRGAR